MTTIRLMLDSDAPAVALLHSTTINQGFLSKLGHRFLRELYRGIAADAESCVWVAVADDQVVGFCAYSRDVSAMYRRILRARGARLFWAALPRCLIPQVGREIAETLRYPSKQKARHLPPAEILSIGISPLLQGGGVGKLLVREVLQAARRDGLPHVKVLAGAKLEQANRFYQRCGFRQADEIVQHGETLNVYVHHLGDEP
jgi:ribosomal protein S18 acetylase RimI-like enzyme